MATPTATHFVGHQEVRGTFFPIWLGNCSQNGGRQARSKWAAKIQTAWGPWMFKARKVQWHSRVKEGGQRNHTYWGKNEKKIQRVETTQAAAKRTN